MSYMLFGLLGGQAHLSSILITPVRHDNPNIPSIYPLTKYPEPPSSNPCEQAARSTLSGVPEPGAWGCPESRPQGLGIRV